MLSYKEREGIACALLPFPLVHNLLKKIQSVSGRGVNLPFSFTLKTTFNQFQTNIYTKHTNIYGVQYLHADDWRVGIVNRFPTPIIALAGIRPSFF